MMQTGADLGGIEYSQVRKYLLINILLANVALYMSK